MKEGSHLNLNRGAVSTWTLFHTFVSKVVVVWVVVMVQHLEKPILGVDLGNSTSTVAIWVNDELDVVTPMEETPSYVSFLKGKDRPLVGQVAKSCQVALAPENTVFSMKKVIGRKFSDPLVQRWMEEWGFILDSRDEHDEVFYRVDIDDDEGRPAKFISPQEAAAHLLSKLKEMAEAHMGSGGKIEDAVLAVPTWFFTSQKLALHEAATMAGLKLLRLIDEPTAVALAYAKTHPQYFTTRKDMIVRRRNLIIFDWGGSSICVSVVTITSSDGNEFPQIEVKSSAFDINFGGDECDRRLVNFLCQEFLKQCHNGRRGGGGWELRSNRRAMTRLARAAEKVKIQLSGDTVISVPISLENLHAGWDFNIRVTPTQFNDLCQDVFEIRPMQLIHQALEEAKMSREEMDEVVMVGGTSLIPRVREVLVNFFGEDVVSCDSLGSKTSVALGAALLGGSIAEEEICHLTGSGEQQDHLPSTSSGACQMYLISDL